MMGGAGEQPAGSSPRAPSLLSSFAAMIADDLAAGRELRECKECGALLLTLAYQSKYCTATCQHTAVMRAYRHREAAKKDLAKPPKDQRKKTGGLE